MERKQIVEEIKKQIPAKLSLLAKIFKKHNSTLYVVGGFVRDCLIYNPKKQIRDLDLTSSLTPAEIEKILKNTNFSTKLINKKLGTLQIHYKDKYCFEHTTFRKDNYLAGYHSPDSVNFIQNLDIDAKRRDFTVNSIYYDLLNDKIIDLYDGVDDINKKIIRCVETPQKVFESDGLRILRLLRFYCQLPDFEIENQTYEVAKKQVALLNDISKERIAVEIKKCLDCLNNQPNGMDKFLTLLDKIIDMKLFPIIFKNTQINFENIENNYKKLKKYIKIKENFDFLQQFIAIVLFILQTRENNIYGYALDLLSYNGLQVQKRISSDLADDIDGYFKFLDLDDNFDNYISFVQKYNDKLQNIFNFIGLINDNKSPEQQEKLKYDLEGAILYMKLNDIPFSKKDLPITGYDIRKNFPQIQPNKINEMLDYAFQYATKHYTLDKIQLMFALDRKEKKYDIINSLFGIN